MRLEVLALFTLSGVLATSAVALAQDRRVELVMPSATTCVSTSQMAEELERSGVSVTMVREPSQGAETSIRVEGAPESLEVVLRRGGVERRERMARATCETATDVISAFVVSAIGKPPDDVVEPEPEPARQPKAVETQEEKSEAPAAPQPVPQRPRLTIHLHAGGELALIWLARFYRVHLNDPARIRGGTLYANTTRLGRAEGVQALAAIEFGRAALGLGFETMRGHMNRRPSVFGEAGVSLDPTISRQAWSLVAEGHRDNIVASLGVGLVTTVERVGSSDVLFCCGDTGGDARELVQQTYLLSLSGGYRSALIADVLFWELRGRASVAGFNPFPVLRLLVPSVFGHTPLNYFVDGASLGLELGLSFN